MRVECAITHGTPPGGIAGSSELSLTALQPAEWPAAIGPFLHQHVRFSRQRCALAVRNSSPTRTPMEHELIEIVSAHYARASVQQATLGRFVTEWGRNFCRTLTRNPRWATSIGQPLLGLPAFIVSAGPSLDRNGALLAEAQKRGPIICVNTSVSACLHHGVIPDLVVAAEAANLSDHLAPLRGLNVPVAIDAAAHPSNWDVAENPWALPKAEPNYLQHVLDCGAVPISYQGSVACAAVSLALYWGASPIVLLGQDCAYTGGRYYAQGTPYADLQAHVVGDLVMVTGRSKEQEPLSVVHLPAYGGQGTVPSDLGMATFVDWFRTTADHHRIVNATEGGARIEYSYELPLSRVLDQFPARSRDPLPQPERVDASKVVSGIRAAAERVLADSSVQSVPPDLPLLNLWTVELALATLTAGERLRRRRGAMERGCREILEALG